jgi:hypothetical protein
MRQNGVLRRRKRSRQSLARSCRETQDIVDAVMYLEDVSFVTGEILHVDGDASAGRW